MRNLFQRVIAVRENWPNDQPAPASLIRAVLDRRGRGKNTADVAKSLRIDEHEVARISDVDADNRYLEKINARRAG